MKTYVLTVISGAGGTVSKDPNGDKYGHGTLVVLEASAKMGYGFDGWASTVTGSESPVTITMDGNKSVTTNWTKNWACNDNVKDSRDNWVYKTVEIGSQCWMAENLNYPAAGTYYYNNLPSNCTTYGRMYDWPTAVANNHGNGKDVCPSGWHLPSKKEFEDLLAEVGNSQDKPTGKRLKSEKWDGSDDFGFNARAAGDGLIDENNNIFFFNLGSSTGMWASTLEEADYGDQLFLEHGGQEGFNCLSYDYTTFLFSVRCIKD